MRLFLAIDPPPQVKDQLDRAVDTLRQASRSGRFTRRQNLHITLVFLGDMDREEIPAIAQVMEAADSTPFTLYTGALGQFRRPDGDICWLGLEPSPPLTALHRRLVSGLEMLGYPLERRGFTPHLTLGRKVIRLGSWSELEGAFPAMAIPVEAVVLMESVRIDGRLVYRPVHKRGLR